MITLADEALLYLYFDGISEIRREEHKGNVSPLSVWNQAEPDIWMGTYFSIVSQVSDKIMIYCHGRVTTFNILISSKH